MAKLVEQELMTLWFSILKKTLRHVQRGDEDHMVLLVAVRGMCCCYCMTVRGDAWLLVMQVSKKNIGAAAGSALSSGKDSVMDVLVMENVLYAANTTRIYDLKGSERSRWSPEDPTQAGAVLMDDNLRENNLTQPILVSIPLPSSICILYAVWLGSAHQ